MSSFPPEVRGQELIHSRLHSGATQIQQFNTASPGVPEFSRGLKPLDAIGHPMFELSCQRSAQRSLTGSTSGIFETLRLMHHTFNVSRPMGADVDSDQLSCQTFEPGKNSNNALFRCGLCACPFPFL
jgi:hypothetical protein